MRSLAKNGPACQIVGAFLLLTGCMCVVSTAARAQALGVITGGVTDPSGAAVPRAHVTATETGTGFERSITTDDTGHYTVPSLRPTEYSLTVEASGFAKYFQKNVRLIADQTATIDVQLKVGSTAETMTVSATAADTPLVDSATPTLTDVVGNTRIEELPLNGRAVAQLIALVAGSAGASPTAVATQSSLPGSVQPSINGARNAQTGYLLDGAPFLDQYYNTNIPFPFPDSLQEFSVQTSNYSARYGGNRSGRECGHQERNKLAAWKSFRLQPQPGLQRRQCLQRGCGSLAQD